MKAISLWQFQCWIVTPSLRQKRRSWMSYSRFEFFFLFFLVCLFFFWGNVIYWDIWDGLQILVLNSPASKFASCLSDSWCHVYNIHLKATHDEPLKYWFNSIYFCPVFFFVPSILPYLTVQTTFGKFVFGIISVLVSYFVTIHRCDLLTGNPLITEFPIFKSSR